MKALGLAVTLSLSSLLALPWPWLPSPRERTSAALEAWEAGDYATAAAALEEALALDPEDPRVRFNAGTGRLVTGRSEEAAELLEQAARSSQDDELAPDAFFNLGNALLEAEDAAGAVEAYKESLRRDPSHAAAKHNLELALRQEAMPQGPGGDREEENDEDGEGAATGTRASAAPDADSDPGRGDDPGGLPDSDEGMESPSRLPDFQPQQDLTAEQAASLLEAVEAIERDQRRARAAETRRQRTMTMGTEKDW